MSERPNEEQQIGPNVSEAEFRDIADETIVAAGQETSVDFDELLQKTRSIEEDSIVDDQHCQQLIERLKDVKEIRRLAKEMEVEESSASEPKVLGQFELLESLGGGGMGQVFKARHSRLGKIQAVKVLHSHKLSDKAATDRFHQEMRAIGQLHHPNVVAAHHADEADGVPYLVMDYVDGQSLAQLVRQQHSHENGMSVGAACELVRQAALGIQYAHDQGIVHRDIKPGNIMLDQFGVVRILDLGLARITSQSENHNESPELTTDQQILGTPDYMAPEQLRSSRNVDGQTDLYALGATLFYLLSGRVLYPSESGSSSLLEKAMQIMNDSVPDIRELRPNIPVELADLVTKCLQKDPQERVSSAGELADQLSQWASAEALLMLLPETEPSEDFSLAPTRTAEKAASGHRSSSPGKQRRNPLTAIGLALALVGVFTAAMIIHVKTDYGDLVVTSDDNNVEFTVKRHNGEPVDGFELTGGKGQKKLRTGKYEVIITGANADQFKITDSSVTLSRGNTATVTIERRVKEDVAAIQPGHSVAAADYEAERKTAEWVLSVNGRLLELQGHFAHGRSKKNVTSLDELPEQPFVITRLAFLEDSIIEDRDLENIKGLSLHELHLGKTKITAGGIDKVKTELSHVRMLYLSGSRFTDAGLQMLGSGQAERLDLTRTQVTDKGLDHLKHFKYLRVLNLNETKVTADGIAALKIALPKCVITSNFTEEQIGEAIAKIDSGKPPLVMKNIPGRPSDDELLKRFSAVDWQPGDAAKLEGYASFPTSLSNLPFDWQVLPKFAQHKYYYSNSPKGTYVAVYHDQTFDPYIRILERKSGRLVGMFYNRGRYERRISWSPDETKFVVSWWNWNLLYSTVCRLDGTVLAEWSNERGKDSSIPLPAWSPDGSRILFIQSQSLEQRTPDGKPVESFDPPEHQGSTLGFLTGRSNSFWSVDGARFALAIDGEVRVYSKDGGQPIAVLKDENGMALNGCTWHPSGEKILTNGDASPGETGAARLWTLSGEYIHFGFRNLHEAVSGFSPDGRFLITNYGDIRDMADNSVSKLDINQLGSFDVGTVSVRWTEPDRIVMFSPSMGPGASVEFSPTGKKLVEYNHPLPIPQNSLSWSNSPDQFLSIGTSPVGSWNMNWGTDSKKDSSAKLPKTLRGFVAFSPTKEEYAGTNNNSPTYVFNRMGKLQRTIRATGDGRLCSWSPDGALLATASGHLSGGPIDMWRGEEKKTSLEGHKHEVLGLTWSPDGSYLTVWDSGLNVSIWDVKSPEKPVTQRTGHGFQLGRSNNYWSGNSSCPRWSPDGKKLAIPTETAVILVSPTGAEDISIPLKNEELGAIWWRRDGQALIVGKTIYDLAGKNIGKLSEDNNRTPFLNWISDEKLVTAWHRRVAIYDQVDQPATVLSLPGFSHNKSPRVSMILRGMNAQRVSSDQRYLIHHSGVAPTSPDSHGGGDIYLVDLQEKRHMWTGLAYNDGKQVRIEPTGRVQSAPEDFDKYLTYVIRYSTGRIIPQTRLQFASRVSLSAGQQFVQQTLDFGGTVSVAGQAAPLVASDISDARDLPEIEDVTGLNFSANQYLNDNGLNQLGELTSLEHLQLQNTSLTTKSLSEILKLKQLRTLNLSGLKITNSVSAYLPSNLEELDISNTEIGDFFLFDLKTFKSLKRVNVTGTKVTSAGISSLKQALPDCEIIVSQVPKTEAVNAQ